MVLVDNIGIKVKISEDGLVRIDGITTFRIVKRGDTIFLQFVDHDRMRVQCRGTKYVEVPFHVIVEKVDPKDSEEVKDEPEPEPKPSTE